MSNKQQEGIGLVVEAACDLGECNDTELPDSDDFPLGQACDLSGEADCEACQ